MSEAARRVRAQPFSEDVWEPFGWVPVADTDSRDGHGRLRFDWDDVHVNLISHHLAEVTAIDGGLRCDMLYRHDTHTQALMPLDRNSVIAVSPPAVEFTDAADAETIRAFVLQPHDAVVLHQGTWHWGPFPIGSPTVTLFNVQGIRYREDNRCVDLSARGLSIDIQTA